MSKAIARRNLQEWLTEILLDSITLMVNVVVIDIVMEQELARIPPKSVSAVVIDGLCAAECEEQCCLACRHARERFRDNSSEGIEQESFDGMVV